MHQQYYLLLLVGLLLSSCLSTMMCTIILYLQLLLMSDDDVHNIPCPFQKKQSEIGYTHSANNYFHLLLTITRRRIFEATKNCRKKKKVKYEESIKGFLFTPGKNKNKKHRDLCLSLYFWLRCVSCILLVE